ncbi:MAG: serine hydrolase [Firmicutes bacterium]|nr:serine hydrolase [Bacillota bacterium]
MRRHRTVVAITVLAVLTLAMAVAQAASVNPAVAPAGAEASGHPGYAPLESRIRAYLSRDPATWGIYFIDLDSGKTFGVNPDTPIPQASLVKVPLVLYINHLVSRGEMTWDDQVAYRPDTDYRGGAGAMQFFAQPGWTYSVRVLANLAITLSDNVTKAMLVRYVGAGNLVKYMSSLGASQPHVNGEDSTTARDMAVYLQAILSLSRERPDLGQRLLDDLSHSIWHVGLPGRLPKGVRVAHKEGDITGVSNDAGVVFSRHPYVICILSKGQPDAEAGFSKIADISRMVYDYQEQVYGGN